MRFYGGVVEMAFGAMERSLESYMIAVLGNELSDFQNHNRSRSLTPFERWAWTTRAVRGVSIINVAARKERKNTTF